VVRAVGRRVVHLIITSCESSDGCPAVQRGLPAWLTGGLSPGRAIGVANLLHDPVVERAPGRPDLQQLS